jgi:hypothetical protein
MKQLHFFFLFLLPTFGLVSCGGSSQGNKTTDSTSAISSDNNTSTGDASFSCMLDGKELSGKGTDQNINAAFHMTGEDKGRIFFRLSDVNNPSESLNFLVPAKEGTTTFDPTYAYSLTAYVTKDYINYVDNPLTVTINSLSAVRISGTFSGKYTLSTANAGNAKPVVEVTDGKFDIPFSNSAEWKKTYHAE